MEQIKLFVERQTGCRATLHESCVVTWENEDGDKLTRHVSTFRLDGHETARRAYAWQKEGSIGTHEPEYSMMLGIPPVVSAETALREFWMQALKSL